MQSPTAVAFRAFVMLACLVAVPLAAVFNAPLRDFLHKVIDAQRSSADGRSPATSPAPLFNDPAGQSPYRATATATPQSSASSTNNAANIARNAPLNNSAPSGFAPMSDVGRSSASAVMTPPAGSFTGATSASGASPALSGSGSVVPAGFNRPQTPGQFGAAATADFSQPAGGEPTRPTTPPGEPLNNRLSGAAAVRPAASPSDVQTDSFKQIEHRMQELGATYYRLETFGGGQEPYRFYCMVSLNGDLNHNRVFEARDADPLQAMKKVLHDVEEARR